MAAVTPTQIVNQILAGTFPDGTLNSNNVFTYEQYVRRRRYPSCEVIITTPVSTEETQEKTNTIYSFEVRYYNKNLGQQTDEISTVKSVEDVILTQLESLTLQDHKIVFESKIWNRQQYQRDGDHPAYIVSVLKVTVRQVKLSTATQEGTLTFKLSGSTVDNPPASDYIYVQVNNVDITEGYRGTQESVSTSPRGFAVPIHYTGSFNGKIVIDFSIGAADIGSTGDKLNKLMTLQSSGEKPEVKFTYGDKTNATTPQNMTETVFIKVDKIQRLYRTTENVVFRLYGDVIVPSTITVS